VKNNQISFNEKTIVEKLVVIIIVLLLSFYFMYSIYIYLTIWLIKSMFVGPYSETGLISFINRIIFESRFISYRKWSRTVAEPIESSIPI